MSLQSSSSLSQISQSQLLQNGLNNNVVNSSLITEKQTMNSGRLSMGIEENISEDEARRRREQLNRRPSYRMILKDLETVGDKPLKKELNNSLTERNLHISHISQSQHSTISSGNTFNYVTATSNNTVLNNQNESNNNAATTNMLLSNRRLNVSLPSVATAAILRGDISSHPLHINTSTSPLLSATAAAVAAAVNNTIVLPTSNFDIINLKPTASITADAISAAVTAAATNSVFSQNNEWKNNLSYNSNHHSASTNNSIACVGINLANTPNSINSLSDTDDNNRKRQVRLLKNREAAKECRRKKKEYVKCLENRVTVLENQNKALIEELKTLKELYCRKEKTEN